MRTRAEHRKLTWKRIRHNINKCNFSHKGSNADKAVNPHRLYKGLNFKNYGGYAFNTKNLGLSKRDLQNEATAKEELENWDED